MGYSFKLVTASMENGKLKQKKEKKTKQKKQVNHDYY